MDRRLKTRVEWKGPIKYRLEHTDSFKTGLLTDISTTGAMLWLKGDIPVGSRMEVVMQSEYDPAPVHMHMRVVRTEGAQREGYTGYGCQLELTAAK